MAVMLSAGDDEEPLPDAVREALRRRWQPGPDYSRDVDAWLAKHEGVVFLWSRQREIVESVRDNPQTAVQSCHSAGKSFVAAMITAWWLDSHPPGEAFVVTSAPTGDQVKAILWREIGRAHKKLNLAGRTNLTEWYVGDEIVAFGRKPSDYEPTAFQGIHAKFVLVILDEACGIPKQLFEAASSLTSNENGRILAIGNPDDPQSHFAAVCASGTWHTIKISAYDTPNFTGESVPDYIHDLLVARRWVDEKKEEWGELSPMFTSKVLGEFPTDAEDGVVPLSWLTQCRLVEHVVEGDVEAGLDVSGGGKDRSVLWLRRGQVALRSEVLKGEKDPDRLAAWVAQHVINFNVTCIKVDAAGLGWGVGALIGHHLPRNHYCSIVPVNVGESADDDEHFLNCRAEIWWMAREYSRTHWWDLRAVDDDTINELSVPKYHTINPRQRIQVEKKDEVKKRLNGLSPDSADALILAFHTPTWEAEDLTVQVASFRIG